MLNYLAPINNVSYGIVGTNLLSALWQEGIEASLFPIGGGYQVPYKHHQEWLKKGLEKAIYFDHNAPSFRLYHQFALQEHIGRGLKFGYSFFELDKLQPHEVHQINCLDLMFSPSEWAKRVMIESGVKTPIQILMPGVDTILFDEAKPANITTDQPNPTVFLSCGKWELRKNHDGLLDCFNKAFEPKDNVLLITLHHNPIIFHNFNGPQESKKWNYMYANSKMGLAGKINIIDQKFETQAEIASIMKVADCGVCLSKAEGWDMPLAEMLYLGKQCIATNYSAHTQFAWGNCHLVDINEKEEAFDGVFFKGGQGSWAKFGENQIDQTVELIRKVHRAKQEKGKLGFNYSGMELFTNHITYSNMAKRIKSILF